MLNRSLSLLRSLFIILILFSCSKKSENTQPIIAIPNGDFENWEVIDNFSTPVSWGTSNFSLFGVVTFNTVTKESAEPYSGSFYPKLETKNQYVDNKEVKVAGILTLGKFEVNLSTRKARVYGGVPFVSNPISLEGYYKYSGVGIDSCLINISITKYNKNSHKSDLIGQGYFSSSSVSSWSRFQIPIHYYSSLTPDSMNIIISSSDTSIFEVGSTLLIDNISLKYQ